MKWNLVSIFLVFTLIGGNLHPAAARRLTPQEMDIAIQALIDAAGTNMSNDPSCQSNLAEPRSMQVAQGIARVLSRAAGAKKKLSFVVQCFERTDWPKKAGQEYCGVSISDSEKTGLVFLMDWPSKSVVEGSVECAN